MVEKETAVQVSGMSIQMAGVFALIGVALMYLYIGIAEVPSTVKVLWASGLSLGVAFTFLVIWTFARDFVRQREMQKQ
jgi:positive regulator of sigma E activity